MQRYNVGNNKLIRVATKNHSFHLNLNNIKKQKQSVIRLLYHKQSRSLNNDTTSFFCSFSFGVFPFFQGLPHWFTYCIFHIFYSDSNYLQTKDTTNFKNKKWRLDVNRSTILVPSTQITHVLRTSMSLSLLSQQFLKFMNPNLFAIYNDIR